MFTKRRSLKKAGKSGTLVFGVGLLAAFVMMLAALWPVPRVQAATTVINVCGQNTTAGWNLLSYEMSDLRAKLDNPANFGPAGTYGDFDFNYVDVGDNFTEAILAGNSCNIWFSGYEGDSTYTPAEFTALQNWVTNHNGQVFAGCDASSNDPVCQLLGFSVTNDTDSYGFVVQQLVNPITCDGVLTPDDALEMSGGLGAYFTGPGVTATNVLAVHETGGVADPTKPIIIYTGAFFMTSDIDMVSIYTLTSGGGVTNNNDIMAVNAFSALADVSIGNDICSSAGPQTADLTITKATNPAGGTDFPFVLNPDDIGFLAKWGSLGNGNGQFSSPYGVAVDGNGNVYVADAFNHRIQKFDAGGTWLAKWGGFGNGNGQFNNPFGVAVDGDGNVYVTDALNHRIQKFDSSGAWLATWGGSGSGSGNGQFNTPYGVAVDGNGNVYVADTSNNRIQKFDANGIWLVTWGSGGSGNGQFNSPRGVAVDGAGHVYVTDANNHRIQKFDDDGTYLAQWGGNGTGNGQLAFPRGVAVDGAGNVYVTDSSNNRIQKFDANGVYLAQWGGYGSGNGQLALPVGVAVDGAGNVYVTDRDNNRIQKFGPDGATLDDGQSHTFSGLAAGVHEVAELVPGGWTLDDVDCGNAAATRDGDTVSVTLAAGDEVTCTFTNVEPASQTAALTITKATNPAGGTDFPFVLNRDDIGFLAKWGGYGDGNGQFTSPYGVATDGNGNVYVADTSNDRIQKFDGNGTYLTQWGSYGSGNGQFATPTGVAVDGAGNVYVVDSGNQRIQKFAAGGAWLITWGGNGSGNGQFANPRGVAVDGDGNVYVADSANDRIQKFDANGIWLVTWGSSGSGNGQFDYPTGVAVDGAGNVYVVDSSNNRIQKFDVNGVYQTKWGSNGSGNGQFYFPYGVAVDGAGNVYVVETNNQRIQKFDANGTYLGQWGSNGTGDGQFYNPRGVAADGAGNVYVADSYNNRIQKFGPDGATLDDGQSHTFSDLAAGVHEVTELVPDGWTLDDIDCGNAAATRDGDTVSVTLAAGDEVECTFTNVEQASQTADLTITKATNPAGGTDFPFVLDPDSYQFLAKWGSLGSGNGQFTSPYGVATDGNGNVYVADTSNNRIQKFDGNGTYLTQWGGSGSGNGQFAAPTGVAVDGAGNVYVVDSSNHRIQKFAAGGAWLITWGGNGSGNGQFANPRGVAVDGDGNVYVADSDNHRIQKFAANGIWLVTWGGNGSGDGQFDYPSGVAVDGAGNVYVADRNNNRIQKFDAGGMYLTQWGDSGSGNGQLAFPRGVAVDGDGDVYVADTSNHRIQKFDAGGTYLTQWGGNGGGDGQFVNPVGVAVDGAGNVYVADTSNNRVQKFGPDGTTLDDGQSHTFSDLAAGVHTVTELVPDGWTLDDIDCGNATATRDGDTVSVTLAAGDEVECTFTNVQTPTGGTITVTKQAGDVGDQFEFDPSWSDDNFLLYSGGGETSAPLPAGTYSVVEVNLPPGWTQQSATCDNAATTPVETVSPTAIPVADGDDWLCTFTNVYDPTGSITITKATNPAGGTEFPFVLDPDSYQFLAKWGSNGSGNGQFVSPYGVATDGNGNVYVADRGNHRIQKFDANGAYLTQWGGSGSGNGQLSFSRGVVVDGTGNVYVADTGNHRIQKFDANGTYLTQWGSLGGGNGQFSNPVGVAVDGAGNVYVADNGNHRIQKFDSSGTYLTQWGGVGSGNGQLAYPNGVAVDGAGNVYVADTNNNRIQKFDAGGSYLTQWGGLGSGDGQFAFPFGMAIDGAGHVYVADSSNNRIQKFDAGGTYLAQWGGNGGGDGQFNTPTGVAVDGAGNVYVVDTFNHRIQKFGPDGATLDDGQSHTFSGLAAGVHTVTELVPDGWTLDDIDCGNAAATRDGDTVSVTLAVGDEVECTFTNVQIPTGGTITVTKYAGEVSDQFEFDPSWSDDNFLLHSAGEETSGPLPAGTYSVVEVNLPPGWTQQSATCDNAATTPVETVSPTAIPVADGDDWFCIFINVYTPPPANICPVEEAAPLYTDIIGKGMGNTKKHKNQVKLTIPNYAQVDSLYGQLVAKNTGNANYVRFILPGKNNWVQVNAITSPADMPGGNFWYGDYINPQTPTKTVTGRWFLQKTGTKNHIPRALVLYPTYRSAANTWVNIWNTYGAAEGEVYWDTANGWTQERVIVESIAPPNGPTTFNVELALADNDKDARPIWVTVEAGGVTQTQMPNNPSAGDELNLMTFTLPNVPAGTDEITITIYSPSMAADGVVGDSAALVGMAANYMCAPLN